MYIKNDYQQSFSTVKNLITPEKTDDMRLQDNQYNHRDMKSHGFRYTMVPTGIGNQTYFDSGSKSQELTLWIVSME